MTDSTELSGAARLRGGVWGHLVGDAVGVPYEFRPPIDPRSVRFGATGTHGQPPGTWSDDGALMLALLDSLLEAGFDPEDQGRRIVAWYRRGAYTPDGDGVFDVGNTTRSAIAALEVGVPAEQAGGTDDWSNGNGSLMRILPVALVHQRDPDAQLADMAHRASMVTHGTPEAQVTCALYCLVAKRLLAGDAKAHALTEAQGSLRDVYAGDPTRLAALDRVEEYAERGGRGSVWDSFWSAWDAFEGADTYRATIERAVAYGHDTDTTAAIAGGLAGIYWGLDAIPPECLAGMRGRDIVEPLVAILVEIDRSMAIGR
jgi:ADP-ribosylglycohydrolase